MVKIRPYLNFLAIAITLALVLLTALFIYISIHLKNRITLRTVQKTDMVSEVITHSVYDLMSNGHSEESYSLILDHDNIVGLEEIGIFTVSGEEAFGGGHAPGAGNPAQGRRRIGDDELESFTTALATMNTMGVFDWDRHTYSRYVPLVSEGGCASCHAEEDGMLGVLKIKFTNEGDLELLKYLQKLIWTLGLIAFLPVGALVVAGAIIREKNRLYKDVEESNKDLKRAYSDLNEIGYYLQMILDNSRVIIVTTDTKGRIVEFNREAERALEYTREEVVGKDVLMLYENPLQREELLHEAASSKRDPWAVRNREVVLRSKTGGLIYVSLTLSTMVNNKGEILGTVGIGKDVSEQKMLQFKLIQSEKLAGIGTLATGIAHEINNPLAGILGMAEAARDETNPELVMSYINDIIRYTEDASDVVKELSAYSRSAKNEATSTVDVSAVIEDSLRMSRHTVNLNSIKVTGELDKGCYILANTGEIQQAFVNLIINAGHAMKDGGTLRLACRREGEFVKAVVSDTGQGISEKDLVHIYDPFFTTKPVGTGTGLGLYVVYRIVTKYRGSIDVESEPGAGTTFSIKFPSRGTTQKEEAEDFS